MKYAKCCRGSKAIPLLGVGSIVSCLVGRVFVAMVSMSFEPESLNMTKWMLKDVDARRLKRLSESFVYFGLVVGD